MPDIGQVGSALAPRGMNGETLGPKQFTVTKVRGGFIIGGFSVLGQEVCTTIEQVIEKVQVFFQE